MNYTLNGKIYQVVISDGAIELQSLTETIVFQNAYTEICNDLEEEYWKEGLSKTHGLKDYIDYYENQSIRCYLDNHKKDGIVLDHRVN